MMLKPGWQTTEFIATVLVGVGSVVASFADALTPRYAAIASAVAAAAYAIARGLAKNGATRPPAPPTPPTP